MTAMEGKKKKKEVESITSSIYYCKCASATWEEEGLNKESLQHVSNCQTRQGTKEVFHLILPASCKAVLPCRSTFPTGQLCCKIINM